MVLGTTNGNWKEADNGRGTGVFVIRVSKEKRLQLGRCHSEFDDAIVVWFEGALAATVVVADDIHVRKERSMVGSERLPGFTGMACSNCSTFNGVNAQRSPLDRRSVN